MLVPVRGYAKEDDAQTCNSEASPRKGLAQIPELIVILEIELEIAAKRSN